MEVRDLLQELDNFSDEDCEGDKSNVEAFKIGDNNESESVAATEEDEERSCASATTPKTGYGYSLPNEVREIKEVTLEVRDLLTIFVNQASKQVTPGLESTSSSTGLDGDALTDNLTPKRPNKQISLNIRVIHAIVCINVNKLI